MPAAGASLQPPGLEVNANLLVCLRRARERLGPAVAHQKRERPLRDALVRPFRFLSPLATVPLSLPPGVRFLLAARVRPNSKAEAVWNEMTRAGVATAAIGVEQGDRPGALVSVGRLLYRLPGALWVAALVVWRCRRLDSVDLQVILGRWAYRRLLHRRPNVMPIIISDITPQLHMLWSAAAAEGCAVLWWQDDLHHRRPLPYAPTVAAVLNQGGLEMVRRLYPDALVVKRPQTEVKPMRGVPENPRVGVATNVSFGSSAEEREFLNRLRQALGVPELRLRLHPNSRLGRLDFPEPWVEVAPVDESIEAFADNVDIAVVGNSAVQLKLLCEGVAVLHIAGLDRNGFDHYGYCEQGFVFGVEQISAISLERLVSFYSDPELAGGIRDYVRVRDEEGLEGLGRLVALRQD